MNDGELIDGQNERPIDLIIEIDKAYLDGDSETFNRAADSYESLKRARLVGETITPMVVRYGGGLYRDPDRIPIIKDSELAADRFFVVRGSENGYHLHLYESRRHKDTGVMLTVTGDDGRYDVFAENHRVGKVSDSLNISKIGEKEKITAAEKAISEIGNIPAESRRQPSQSAVLIYSSI